MSKAVSQHKRMAMGQKLARGGSVMPIGAGKMVSTPALSGGSRSPLTTARRNNGIPGMKSGGLVTDKTSGSDKTKGTVGVKGVRGTKTAE